MQASIPSRKSHTSPSRKSHTTSQAPSTVQVTHTDDGEPCGECGVVLVEEPTQGSVPLLVILLNANRILALGRAAICGVEYE